MHELAHRGLPIMHDELVIFPLVAERRFTTKGFAQLRADRHGGCHAVGDFLALPFGHRRNHGVEEPAR